MSDERLLFEKTGRACYISHLDLMRTFQRAFLRAGIDIKHTEGFNPHAFVSIPLPLSVGYSSRCELLEFGLVSPISMTQVPELMNPALPEGIVIRSCYAGGKPVKQLAYVDWTVELEYDGGSCADAAAALSGLLARESLVMDKKSKKSKSGFTQVDIIPMVRTWSVEERGSVLELHCVLAAQNPGLNPELIVGALRREYPQLAPDFARCRRNEVLDEAGEVFR